MLIRLSVDEVMWCPQQSVNHQGQGLLCNLHCATTVVLREQLNFKSAVLRSERSWFFFRRLCDQTQTSTWPNFESRNL